MDVKVVRGAQANCLLADTAFIAEWADLADGCPWATSFQTPAFCQKWYSIYRQPFEAVLVLSRDAAGRLIGLLPLALYRAEGNLVAAGSHQAEYQAWICLPELASSFACEAFEVLRREFPSKSLRLRYLPARTPLTFLSDQQNSGKTLLKSCRRPFMALGDGTEVEESFRKQGNKNRIRQLKRIGPVEFSRVTDPGEFAELLEDVVRYHDCRQLASHGSTPFLTDSRKKAFHLAMMNTPGLLHVTVLKVGDDVASVHLNIVRGKEVQLFLIAHSPMFARFSPGKLHVLHLARMLHQEGYERLDLTPGGDAYKERFATGADEVHNLTIFPSISHRMRGVAGARLENVTRAAMESARVNPLRLRSLAWKVSDLGLAGSIRRLARFGQEWTRSLLETRIYAYPASEAREMQVVAGIRRDCLSDLLAYKPAGSGLSRQEFLADAMTRFEQGQHVYTYVEGGRLLVFGWLAEEPAPNTLKEIALPPNSAAVLKFQICGSGSETDLSSLALRTMIRDAGRIEELQTIFIALAHTNLLALDLVRAVGFRYQASIFKRTRFGRRESWSQLAPRSPERRSDSKSGNANAMEIGEETPLLQSVEVVTASPHAHAISA